MLCDAAPRSVALAELLDELNAQYGTARNPPRVMVFVNEIKHLKKVAAQLKASGVRCEALHGERSQREREDTMALFKAGAAPVLFTTDLAGRGIDIAKLPAVINFDPPASASQYVHRAGRTGRQGASGLVVTLLRRDRQSRHFASQVRGLLVRSAGNARSLPPAISSLLGNEVVEESSAASSRRVTAEVAGKVKKKRPRDEPIPLDAAGDEASGAPPGGLGDLLSFACICVRRCGRLFAR